MRGEIFCFDYQESEVLYATHLLRRHVYPGIQVKVHRFGKDDKWNAIGDSAFRYAKLLQAAIHPASSVRVYPKERTVTGCMYIEVLYRMAGSGWRSYAQLKEEELELFFPALALRDRMFIVSRQVAHALGEGSIARRTFRAIDKAGILQVNFSDDEAIESAIVEAGNQVRGEVTNELAAYASYQKDWVADLPRAGALLNVDAGYILHCMQAGAVDRVIGRQLECRLDKARVPLNAWTKVNLKVSNRSEAPVNGAEVVVTGPAKIRPGRVYVNLPAKSTTLITLAVMPLEAGDVPLEFTFAMPSDKPFSSFLPAHHVWLRCGAPDKVVPRRGNRARGRKPKAMERAASR